MSTLKLVMATSRDGIVSLGPDDDMLWTGESDKKAFRLLTSVGGVLGAGRRTFENLPVLKGRTVRCLSHRRGRVAHPQPKQSYCLDGEAVANGTYASSEMLTLDEFAQQFPQGWLIGGQTVALEALASKQVNEVFMCRAPIDLRYEVRLATTFQQDSMTPWLRVNARWTQTDEFTVGDTRIEVWRFK